MEAIIDNSFEKEKLNENIKKIKKRIKNLKIFSAFLFFFGLTIGIYGFYEYYINSISKLNELGDFLAGTVGIIWALLSVVLIYIAFLAQNQQLEIQMQELIANQNMFQKQIDDNNLKTRMEIHSKFQSEMRNIQRAFSDDVNEDNYNPKPSEIRNITIYWYFVFDEWFTCKNGGKIIESLWTNHYREGAKSALTKVHFKKEVDRLLKRKNSFLGQGKEFERELQELIRENKLENK